VASAVGATDIPIVGRKLIIVDKSTLIGTGNATFVAKDGHVGKGSGTDPRHIEATLHVAYDAVQGAFVMPRGTHWLTNFPSIANDVNFKAPAGGAVRVSLIEPGKLLKMIADSVGDRPVDMSEELHGPVYVMYAIVNAGEETRLCTQFTQCKVREFGARRAHKL